MMYFIYVYSLHTKYKYVISEVFCYLLLKFFYEIENKYLKKIYFDRGKE